MSKLNDDSESWPIGFAFLNDEEQKADPVKEGEVNERVAQAELPPQTIEQAEKYNDMFYSKFGHCFKNQQDSDYFAMLPLSHKERIKLLYALRHGTNDNH